MREKIDPSKASRKHVLITCYDNRIDGIVTDLVNGIRSQGEILTEKDILRPPGGVHLLAGKSRCREAFYDTLTGFRDIAGAAIFHIFPHTNCQFCGIHHKEKIGKGTQSDLRFHLLSAEKLLQGMIQCFSDKPGRMPEFDVRIILTIDQRVVTIQEAHELLPEIPPHHDHGHPCCCKGETKTSMHFAATSNGSAVGHRS